MAARQREPIWLLYVLSLDILCFFSVYLYTESVYFILLCIMSNKVLPYHITSYPNLLLSCFLKNKDIHPYNTTCRREDLLRVVIGSKTLLILVPEYGMHWLAILI